MADKKKNIGNDDIIRFLWQAINYPETLDKDIVLDDSGFADAKKARTFGEFRNHVIQKASENPEYLVPVLESMTAYMDEDVPATAWSQSAAKQKDLNLDNMGRADVDALTQALALQLGFADNDETNGALKAMLSETYGKNTLMDNVGRRKMNELIYGKLKNPETRDPFLAALDFSPYADDDYVYDELMKRVLRSQRVKDYDEGNTALKFLSSMAFPQSSKKQAEGLVPNNNDMMADLGTLGALALTKNPLIAAGVGIVGDVVHDAVEEGGRTKEYEYGENERTGKGDWKEGAAGQGRGADVLTMLALGGAAGGMGRGLSALRNARFVKPMVDKAGELVGKGADKVLGLFGKGGEKAASRSEKAAITRQKNKVEKARKDAYEAEVDAKRFSPDKSFENEEELGASIEEAAAKRIFAEDKASRFDAERRKLEEMLAKQGAKSENNLVKYLKAAGRGAGNVASGRIYDPNFYAVDFLQGLLRPKE